MPEAITDILLHETTRERYLNYALSVITSRALPDVRDGLKPVQRRILYAMFHNLRLVPESKFRKSAAVVGEVMAKYHPHGDQSIYDAMVRMAQDFSLRYPLVDGQGNFGSVDGDGAAAMRYTEARLQHLAVELLEELKKETVDLRANYDGTILEPVVLPAQVPNLLINGATGIAVGMATHIPPHNLGEVVRACLTLIDDPETPFEAIVGPIIRGPDFPTGGEILNDVESLREIYKNGRGPIELRGTWRVETENRRRYIIVDSIPYGLNKSTLIGDIAEHIAKGRIPQIVDIRDESTEDVRVVMELKRRANPEAAMAWLFKRTALASRFNVNLTALCPTDSGACQPRRVTLMELLREFLKFRLEVVNRRLRYDLAVLRKRIHILEGFEILFDALDEAIALIRASDGKADARDKLMARFELDWDQAEAILETKLYRLAKLEIEEIRAELAEKRAAAEHIESILASEEKQWALIRGELKELLEAYGDKRRTRVTGPIEEKTFSEDVYIVKEDTFVIVTRGGWFKRQKSYTDIGNIRVREGDEIGWIVPCDSREAIILFSDRGKAFTLRTADIPLTTGYGEAIQTRFGLGDGARVIGVATSDKRVLPPLGDTFLATVTADDPNPPYFAAVTKAGRCMRMSLDGFFEPSTVSGRIFMRLDRKLPGKDAVLAVYVSDGDEMVSLASRESRALVFHVGEINVLANPGKGVLAMKLNKGDYVVGFALSRNRMEGLQITTSRGRDETVRPNKFKPSSRGGRGREIVRLGHIASVSYGPIEWRFPDVEDEAEVEEVEGAEVEPEPTSKPPMTIAQLAREVGVKVISEAPRLPKAEPKTEPKTEPKAAKPEPKTAKPEPKAAKPEPKTAKPEPKAAKPKPKPKPAKDTPAVTPVDVPPIEAKDAPADDDPVAEAKPQSAKPKPKPKPKRGRSKAKPVPPPDPARVTGPISPRPKSKRVIKPKADSQADAVNEDRLSAIARVAVERYKKRAKKPPDDDPNQGKLF